MINLTQKRILITGANGFLGSHLVKNLINKRGVPTSKLFVPSSKQLDLRIWKNCVEAVQGQDIVIHLAAKVGGIEYNQSAPGELFYDNAIMGIQLMEAARQAGVKKFVALGTICAYPKFTPIPFKEESLWDGYPEETNASYGIAKKMLLVQSQAYRKQFNFNSIYLLPVNLYGPGDNFNKQSSHVIPAIIQKINEAQKIGSNHINIWGTGEATREFLFVEDAAEAIALATERYDKSEPVNIGSGSNISIKELVFLICELMNFNGELHWNTTMPEGQPRRMLDTSKAEKEFGFKARTNFKEGLKKTIEQYKYSKV